MPMRLELRLAGSAELAKGVPAEGTAKKTLEGDKCQEKLRM